jgi:hypothetical protein
MVNVADRRKSCVPLTAPPHSLSGLFALRYPSPPPRLWNHIRRGALSNGNVSVSIRAPKRSSRDVPRTPGKHEQASRRGQPFIG